MNLEQIARRAREIRSAENRAMFGTPPGADDDLDGDAPKVCAECDGDRWVPTGHLNPAYVACPDCGGSGKA